MWIDRALLVEYRADPLQLGFERGALVLRLEQEIPHDVSPQLLEVSACPAKPILLIGF